MNSLNAPAKNRAQPSPQLCSITERNHYFVRPPDSCEDDELLELLDVNPLDDPPDEPELLE